MNIEEIITKLNSIDFHDIPVDIFCIKPDKSIIEISLLHFDEIINDYRNINLMFLNVSDLNINDITLTNKKIELNCFEYYFNNKFNCKLTFLLGFGQASFDVNFKCDIINFY